MKRITSFLHGNNNFSLRNNFSGSLQSGIITVKTTATQAANFTVSNDFFKNYYYITDKILYSGLITSITSTSSQFVINHNITSNTPASNGYVIIYGCSNDVYNGIWQVSSSTSTSVTISIPNSFTTNPTTAGTLYFFENGFLQNTNSVNGYYSENGAFLSDPSATNNGIFNMFLQSGYIIPKKTFSGYAYLMGGGGSGGGGGYDYGIRTVHDRYAQPANGAKDGQTGLYTGSVAMALAPSNLGIFSIVSSPNSAVFSGYVVYGATSSTLYVTAVTRGIISYGTGATSTSSSYSVRSLNNDAGYTALNAATIQSQITPLNAGESLGGIGRYTISSATANYGASGDIRSMKSYPSSAGGDMLYGHDFSYAAGYLGGLTSYRTSQVLTTYATNPKDIACHSTGLFVYIAKYNTSEIQLFTVPAGYWSGTTTLTASTNTALAANANPYSLATTTDGKFLFCLNVGSASSVQSFTTNSSTGAIASVSTLNLSSQANEGKIIVHPTLNIIYVVTSGTNSVHVYSYNTTSGALTSEQTTALPSNSGAIHVCISPNGKFLYVSKSLLGSMQIFSLNATSGLLTDSGNSFSLLSGYYPHCSAVGPTSDRLYIACNSSMTDATSPARIQAYDIDSSTGSLTILNMIHSTAANAGQSFRGTTANNIITMPDPFASQKNGGKINNILALSITPVGSQSSIYKSVDTSVPDVYYTKVLWCGGTPNDAAGATYAGATGIGVISMRKIPVYVSGGGGGAGAFSGASGANSHTFLANNIYQITIGAGGAGVSLSSSNGNNTVLTNVTSATTLYTAVGGGGGGSYTNKTGSNGGCGGGAAHCWPTHGLASGSTLPAVYSGGASTAGFYAGAKRDWNVSTTGTGWAQGPTTTSGGGGGGLGAAGVYSSAEQSTNTQNAGGSGLLSFGTVSSKINYPFGGGGSGSNLFLKPINSSNVFNVDGTPDYNASLSGYGAGASGFIYATDGAPYSGSGGGGCSITNPGGNGGSGFFCIQVLK